MKKLLTTLSLSLLFASNVYAYEYEQDIYSDMPDYLGTNIIPLTAKEEKALRLSDNWVKQGVDPFLVENGKLVFTHGASMPTILARPMQVCDIELQAGEIVNEIIIGDSARWFVEQGQAGNTTHLFIKPIDAGLETTAVVTTDRRVYHLRLISSRTDFTPYVGFVYRNEIVAYSRQRNAQEAKEKHYNSTNIDGKNVDLSDLNFKYEIKGNYSWKPERVYDDGVKTYIKFNDKVRSEMPILLVRKNKQDALVNYRVSNNNTMMADGVFEEMVLVLGVGSNKEEVRISKD